MDTQIFVNLPVGNLKKSMEFFSTLGFDFNPQFTDDNAACMIIDKNIFVMLITEDFFANFTKKGIANARNSTEVILALTVDSREKVDKLVNKAFAAGGKSSNEVMDEGFMYAWSFQDIDDHLWEVIYMDPAYVNKIEAKV